MCHSIMRQWMAIGLCLVPLTSGCTDGVNSSYHADFLHDGENVSSVAFSPDSKSLAIGYKNLDLRIIDPQTGGVVRVLKGKFPEEPDRITTVAFSPDGRSLAGGCAGRFKDAINTWDVATGKIQHFIPKAAQSVTFSPDGTLLAGGGAEWKDEKWSVATMLWDTKTGKLKRTLRGSMAGYVRSVAFAPDGRTLVMANDIEDVKAQMLTLDVIVSSWNTRTAKMQWSLKEPTTTLPLVAFSPTGKVVANVSVDTVKLRNARTGKLLRAIKMPDKSAVAATALTFSPNGAVLAIGTSSGSVTLWDVETGTLFRTLKYHVGSVSSVAYSQDGKLLASGSQDHTVAIWATQTWTVISSIGKKYEYKPNPFS